MSYHRQREYDLQVNAHEAYTKWVVDNFNDKNVSGLNVDCHSQGLAIHDLGDFNTIKQEKILRDRMSNALVRSSRRTTRLFTMMCVAYYRRYEVLKDCLSRHLVR